MTHRAGGTTFAVPSTPGSVRSMTLTARRTDAIGLTKMTARCFIRERERLHAKGDLERLGACGEQRHANRGGQPLLPRRIVEEGVLPRQLSSLPLSVEGDRELLHGRGGWRTQRKRSLVLLEA